MVRFPRKILAGCCALLALAACTDLPSAEEIAATARVIPDANDLRRVINENRFFTLRSKMRNLVREHWEDTHWALAATGHEPCRFGLHRLCGFQQLTDFPADISGRSGGIQQVLTLRALAGKGRVEEGGYLLPTSFCGLLCRVHGTSNASL